MKSILVHLLLELPVLFAARVRPPPGKSEYVINWETAMQACKDADNKFKLENLVANRISSSTTALKGNVNLPMDSSTDIQFKLTISRKVHGNYEYLMRVIENNLCGHIREKNKPWTPFVREMEITGCPIPAKTYTFRNCTLSSSGFPVSSADVGRYRAKIELFEKKRRVMCLIANIAVRPLHD